MVFRSILLAAIISAALTYGDELTICPNQEVARHVVGNASLNVSGKLLTTLVRTVRLPKIGMYDKKLNCLEVVDLTDDMSSGDVEIIDGGIFERFVELHFKSKIGGSLIYDIQVYTE